VTQAPPISPHLRPRDGSAQPTTAVELLFDLVYVFAITQLSHLLIDHLSLAGAAHTAFLLLVIWWAWIYTTWMVNWFDPASGTVRLVLVMASLASLLMSSAIPSAFGSNAALFAGAYVALQVGRNCAAAGLLTREHELRLTLERIASWSILSGGLWLAGAFVAEDLRLALWGPALLIDLVAPILGYWVPGLGRSQTNDYPVEGGHFAERFQSFIIIALGESIVVTGATASAKGLSTTVVIALAAAFLGTGALWWLYFGEVAEHSRKRLAEAEDTGVLARDAYSYLHLPIVAGIIMVAVGDELLIAAPNGELSTAGIVMMVGGPALYLAGETLFRLRMIGSVSPKRVSAVIALGLLGALAGSISALAVSVLVAGLLSALALWEYERPAVRAVR
ncbi:MAG TPA: low temperature requirement protein A, partial [Solirubrobacteraceae bacterium]